MDQNKAVKIEIGFNGNKLNLDLPFKEFNLIQADLKSEKPKWIQINLNKGAYVDVFTGNIQYIKMRPPEMRNLTKRDGYTLKLICKVMGENYDVFRQQIKKDGIELDKGTERRIMLTPLTIKNLKLTPAQVKKIESTNE